MEQFLDDSQSTDELVGLVRDVKTFEPGLYLEVTVLLRRARQAHRAPRDLLRERPQVVALARDRGRGQA